MYQNKFKYKIDGVKYEVEIENLTGNIAKVNVNGISFEVELQQPISSTQVFNRIAKDKQKINPPSDANVSSLSNQPSAVKLSAPNGTAVVAPLPGTITSVKVNVGDKVNAGDTVVVLEAMKMQNNIEAEKDGTVISVLVKQGDSVLEGSTLVTIE